MAPFPSKRRMSSPCSVLERGTTPPQSPARGGQSSTRSAFSFSDLPDECAVLILSMVDSIRDLARLDCTARMFHAALPSRGSLVEEALRERARREGVLHVAATLPPGETSWTQKLFWDARRRLIDAGEFGTATVSAGDFHSAVIDEVGQLVVSPSSLRKHRITKFSLGSRAVSVATGTNQTLVLLEDGSLFAYGDGHPIGPDPFDPSTWEGWWESYRRGEHNPHGGSRRRRRVHCDAPPRPVPFIAVPGPLSPRVVIRSIATACMHSLAVSASGHAYSWGSGSEGCLGLGDRHDRRMPTRIPMPHGVHVRAAAAGHGHSLLRDSEGAVYSFGGGGWERHQLGHGDCEPQFSPKRIEELRGVKVVEVEAGAGFSIALSDGGELYSWGRGNCGQLGLGGHSARPLPTRVGGLAGKRVLSVAAGERHVLALCSAAEPREAAAGSTTEVYGWGEAKCGQLGQGTMSRPTGSRWHTFASSVDAPALIATQRLLRGAQPVGVAAGAAHSLVVAADGRTYCLGFGGVGGRVDTSDS